MNNLLATFFLVFCRISSFLVIAPGFSLKQAPKMLKIVLSLSFSFMIFSSIETFIIFENFLLFGLQAFKEVLVGLALGFIVQLVFSAIEMAGQIIDFQVGFSMGSVYDPGVGIQGSNYGRLYYWLALAVFFSTDMHHIVIDNLIKSFDVIPVTEFSMTGNTVNGLMILFTEVFKISILLAAPVVLVALVTDCVLGIISRSVPQINVLMLGMPLKILISFFFVLLFIPSLIDSIQKILPNISNYLSEFIQSLAR